MAHNKSKREQLMKEDPHCFWCGIEVTNEWPEGRIKPPANLATLDHVYDKWMPKEREEAWKNGDDKRRVLACYRCNQRRNNDRMKEIPKSAVRIRTALGQERKKLASKQPRNQVFRGLENITE